MATKNKKNRSETKPTIVYLVRPGCAEHSRMSTLKGNGKSKLVKQGEGQAKLIGDALEGAGVTKVYSSSKELGRGYQTAKVLKNMIIGSKPGKRALVRPEFNDIDLGDWEDLRMDGVDQEAWRRTFGSFKGKDVNEIPAPPNGETIGAVLKRSVSAFIRSVKNSKGQSIVIVGHATVNRTLLWFLCNCIGNENASLKHLKPEEYAKVLENQGDDHGFQYEGSYTKITIDGELCVQSVGKNEVPYENTEAGRKTKYCKYCKKEMLATKKEESVVGKDLNGQLVCENYECSFRVSTGFKYVEEIPDLSNIDVLEQIGEAFDWFVESRAYAFELSIRESLSELVTHLSLSLKPANTFINLRVVDRKGSLDCNTMPCISSGIRDGPLLKWYAKLLERVFNSSSQIDLEKLLPGDQWVSLHKLDNYHVASEDDQAEVVPNTGPNDFKTLLLIALDIEDNVKDGGVPDNPVLLLEILLPIKVDPKKLKDFKKSADSRRKELCKELEHLALPKKCYTCNSQECPNPRVRSWTQPPQVGAAHRDAEGTIVSQLENRMAQELGLKRSQIWTLKFCGGTSEHFKFILQDQKMIDIEVEPGRDKERREFVKSNFEELRRQSHPKEGIVGDTVDSWTAEFVMSAWSDLRETRLEESRNREAKENQTKEVASAAERFFYAGRYLDYAAIPIVLGGTYYGAVMVFHREYGEWFCAARFRKFNRKLLSVVSAFKHKLEAAIVFDFLRESMKSLLGEESIEKATIALRAFADSNPFLPRMDFSTDIEELAKIFGGTPKNFEAMYDFVPKSEFFQYGEIRPSPTSNGAIAFQFVLEQKRISVVQKAACDALLEYYGLAITQREQLDIRTGLSRLLADFHHSIGKYIIEAMFKALESGDLESAEKMRVYIQTRGDYVATMAKDLTAADSSENQESRDDDVVEKLQEFVSHGYLVEVFGKEGQGFYPSQDWLIRLERYKKFFDIDQIRDKELYVHTAPGALECVFENIILNSFKHGAVVASALSTEERGRLMDQFKITFRVDEKKTDNNWFDVLSISDNGYGEVIDDDRLEDIHLRRIESPRRAGDRLGLALVNTIMWNRLKGKAEYSRRESRHCANRCNLVTSLWFRRKA